MDAISSGEGLAHAKHNNNAKMRAGRYFMLLLTDKHIYW
jgi:hypothetical protein